MALWEIVLAVQALKAQVETLEATLSAEMAAADGHWANEQAELEAARVFAALPVEVPF